MKFNVESNGITIAGTADTYTLLDLIEALGCITPNKSTKSDAAEENDAPAVAKESTEPFGSVWGMLLEAYAGRGDASHKVVGFRQPIVGDRYIDPTGFVVKLKTTPTAYGPRIIVEEVEQ